MAVLRKRRSRLRDCTRFNHPLYDPTKIARLHRTLSRYQSSPHLATRLFPMNLVASFDSKGLIDAFTLQNVRLLRVFRQGR
jgi:hypothetical protein